MSPLIFHDTSTICHRHWTSRMPRSKPSCLLTCHRSKPSDNVEVNCGLLPFPFPITACRKRTPLCISGNRVVSGRNRARTQDRRRLSSFPLRIGWPCFLQLFVRIYTQRWIIKVGSYEILSGIVNEYFLLKIAPCHKSTTARRVGLHMKTIAHSVILVVSIIWTRSSFSAAEDYGTIAENWINYWPKRFVWCVCNIGFFILNVFLQRTMVFNRC